MLEMTTYGDDAAGPPVLIVHGLFGSGRNWRVIAKRLAESRRIITPDMRNHGTSFRAQSHSYPDMAADLAKVIAHLNTPVDIIGHSMGGKAAMLLALTKPQLVRRLLVADIAPVAYGHSQNHLIDAMCALPLSGLTNRSAADIALSAAISEQSTRAFLLQSLDLQAAKWRLNLGVLRREMSLITGFPDITSQFNGPVLFLSGANSYYVRPEHRPLIKRLFPAARQAKIPDAGHWLHAENPRAFGAAAHAFLNY